MTPEKAVFKPKKFEKFMLENNANILDESISIARLVMKKIIYKQSVLTQTQKQNNVHILDIVLKKEFEFRMHEKQGNKFPRDQHNHDLLHALKQCFCHIDLTTAK
jgi:hypothetical protein